MTTFFRRIVGAAKLDGSIYEEIEADWPALVQAVIVVFFSSLGIAIGLEGPAPAITLASAAAAAFGGWALWAFIVWLVGTRLFPTPETRADWGELLRTTGFATAPGLIGYLGAAEELAGFIVVVASLWMLAAFAVAVEHALDYRSMPRAVAVCSVGWIFYAVALYALVWAHRY
ncbi:MAG: YIP1 family protein [Acidobacteria bacterium]|nr:YIP1 family protein [Acidobacteriota bacterium]MBI3278830.1 YIP1 family protein [Acidobacteriota bacterium]